MRAFTYGILGHRYLVSCRMTLGTQVFPSEFAAKFAEASLVNYIRFRPGAGGHDGLAPAEGVHRNSINLDLAT